MSYILGLDPSLKKTGYSVFNLSKSDTEVEDKGMLKTNTTDGILVLRLIKQTQQVKDLILRYNIKFIGAEAPFFGSFSTEMLFALNQFLHSMYLDMGVYVVYFPPQQLKKLVFPDQVVSDIHKSHMIDQAKTVLGLHGHRLAEDVADAYWAGYFGKKFYKRFIENTLTDEDLSEYELSVFSGTHTFTRGEKKGITEYSGIIYRENECFYDFKKIKENFNGLCKKGSEDKKEEGDF